MLFTTRQENNTLYTEIPSHHSTYFIVFEGGFNELNENFGVRVRRMRLEYRWSQQELSLRSGISTPHISSIENAKRYPSLEYALRLSDALGVSLSALCDENSVLNSPKMKASPDELPLYLQNFVLNEESTPYLQAAHRMSTLPKEDSEFLQLMIDLLAERRHLLPVSAHERGVNSRLK